jgi:flagellar hook-basal body complex protein FliE
MSGVSPAGLGLSGVLALRAQILEKSQALAPARAPAAAPGAPADATGGFTGAMAEALKAVNGLQAESSAAGAAWERGETQDIAAVMLSRQKASIAFEATLQARNRLLSAYRDIMNMPV